LANASNVVVTITSINDASLIKNAITPNIIGTARIIRVGFRFIWVVDTRDYIVTIGGVKRADIVKPVPRMLMEG
jgi:hypothetical protein